MDTLTHFSQHSNNISIQVKYQALPLTRTKTPLFMNHHSLG